MMVLVFVCVVYGIGGYFVRFCRVICCWRSVYCGRCGIVICLCCVGWCGSVG